VLHLAGHLTANTEAEFVATARQLKGAGVDKLLVDLSGIQMLTSAGLRAIHSALLIFTPREEIQSGERADPGEPFKSPHFKLAGASAPVHSILSLAGFLQNIQMYSGLQDALESFVANRS
jgi:hypothetical protein